MLKNTGSDTYHRGVYCQAPDHSKNPASCILMSCVVTDKHTHGIGQTG